MDDTSEIPLRVTENRILAEDWALVLVALRLSPFVRETRDGFVLSVPERERERALAGLAAYDRENPQRRAEQDEPVFPVRLRSGTAVAGTLLIFFFMTTFWSPAVPWLERGSANADSILRGELWRAVTALTLHADLVHALSNAVAAVVFLSVLYGILGVGLGSALVLVAGAGGNLANAVLQGPAHASVGASTAIFSAVAMLGSLGMARLRRRKAGRRRSWLPAGAAFALLAMLGAGGPRVDVLAHLCGFLLGGTFGIVIASVIRRPPPIGLQRAFGCAALALLIGCWMFALR